MNAMLRQESPHGFEEVATDLTEQETLFLYHVEVVGLPVVRAAELCSIKSPHYLLKKPHMVAARAKFKEAIRGDVDFTREDVAFGYKEAIDQAKLLGDPMAQIAGWREIAKLKGYDKQANITFNVHGTIEDFKKQLVNMPTDKLLELAGSDVLDGDFYRVRGDDAVGG
jgi:hypothetical protein